MQFPVDTPTLTAWASLLGMTDEQSAEALTVIEDKLRLGYTFRPLAVRHLTFEQLTADMDVDEFAVMFLETGLRLTGHPEAASDVLNRAMTPSTPAPTN